MKKTMPDTTSSKDSDMYSQLMAISKEAFENEFYETAYHALCAAMHYADATGDEDGLRGVEQAAKTQLDWINFHSNTHKMPTESIIRHSGANLYNSLQTQIKAHLIMLKNQCRQERSHQ